MTHGEYPCHCLAQTLWFPKRGNLELVWDVEELYSTGLPDQNQQVSIVVVTAMLPVRWLEANAGTSEQETTVSTPEQLSNVKMNRNLNLFRTTCKVLRIPKAIERIWTRQRLMPWFCAVMTSWMYERAKLCQSVISGSLTLRDTKIRDFGVKFYFSKFRMEPVMLSFLATTENTK